MDVIEPVLEQSSPYSNLEGEKRAYAEYKERKPASFVGRSFTTISHLIALGLGGFFALIRERRAKKANRKIGYGLLYLLLLPTRVFLNGKIVKHSFPVQLRMRLEMLGATYIKLGQIMSLREDLLPLSITDELKQLLDELPALSFQRYRALLEQELGQPVESIFSELQVLPLGSASIAQVHRAVLYTGEEVALKLLKPGTRELIITDSRIIMLLGGTLDILLPNRQFKNIFREFCSYTNREVDLSFEAENAECFAANFSKQPYIVFPKVYRDYSTPNLLCMEFIKGIKPTPEGVKHLTQRQREILIEYGTESLIQMLFRDGFFHADLHPGNVIIIPNGEEDIRCGFIDVGMIGRFKEQNRKNMLYFFYALVMGDIEGASRYFAAVCTTKKGSDVEGFKKAYSVLAAKWYKNPAFRAYSLAQLNIETADLCAKYKLFFPLENLLMLKALTTFEGVGNIIAPGGVNIQQVSLKYVKRVFVQEVNPLEALKKALQNAPEWMEILSRSPVLLAESVKRAENALMQPPQKDLVAIGYKRIVFAGFLVLGGCVLVTAGIAWPVYAAMFALAGILALKS